MPGKFRAYLENIQEKTGKNPEDFWNIVNEKGFIKEGKIVVKQGHISSWLKTEVKLGHVQANFMIFYFGCELMIPR